MVGMVPESMHVDAALPNIWPSFGPIQPGVGNHNDEFTSALETLRPGQRLLDLVRLQPDPPTVDGYDGICW
jgi:hypothetical protein